MVGLPFELLESKLRPPRTTGRGIFRAALVEQLNRASDTPVVMLCAGPGYGKTTALAQWAASNEQRTFAWVSVDQHDNDPVVLLTYVAVALDRVASIDQGVFEALASPGASVEATVVPRLGAALRHVPRCRSQPGPSHRADLTYSSRSRDADPARTRCDGSTATARSSSEGGQDTGATCWNIKSDCAASPSATIAS
jgi:hypothetical protein